MEEGLMFDYDESRLDPELTGKERELMVQYLKAERQMELVEKDVAAYWRPLVNSLIEQKSFKEAWQAIRRCPDSVEKAFLKKKLNKADSSRIYV